MKTLTAAMIAGLSLLSASVSLPVMAVAAAPASPLADPGRPAEDVARDAARKPMELAAFAGMKVHAAAAGRVIFAGTEPERFGQLIVIDHGDGWASAYAYLGKVSVREGARVSAGAVIARVADVFSVP